MALSVSCPGKAPQEMGDGGCSWKGAQYPTQEIYASAIETEFGICVQMENYSMVENYLENQDIFYPDDETPLTLSWLSSRWQESGLMCKNVRRTPGLRMNNSRFVYQTQINYRRSVNLREGQKSISEDLLRRAGEPQESLFHHSADHKEYRTISTKNNTVRASPKKMWIRHYYLTNGNHR